MNSAYRSFRFLGFAALLALAAATSVHGQYTITVTPTGLDFQAQPGDFVKQASVTVSTSAASGAFTANVSAGATWLSVSPSSGVSLPGSLTIFANPFGLGQGTYTGTVTITAAGATNSPVITVTLRVGPSSGSSLSASPNPMAFTYTVGGSAPAAQTLLVTSAVPTSFSATASSTGNWLSVTPATAVTTGTNPSAGISVSISPAGLGAGSYTGAITLTPITPVGTALSVVVNLTVNAAPQLSVNKSPVTITYQRGTATPRVQTLRVESTGAQLLYTAEFSPAAGLPQFLTVSPPFGQTPADLSLEVVSTFDPPAGRYEGALRITAAGASNSPLSVPVRYFVSDQPFAVVSPDAVQFAMQFGAAPPEAKTVDVTSSNASIQIGYAASVAATPNWLTAVSSGTTTPGKITVGVSPLASSLPPGIYDGKVVVQSGTDPNLAAEVAVRLTISNTPALTVTPDVLTFNYQTGRALPQPQRVSVGSSGVPQTFNVSVETAQGGTWLSAVPPVTPATTPADIIVSVNPAGLASNTNYSGTVKITPTAAGGSERTVPVTFRVSDNPLLNVQPGVLRVSLPQGAATRTEQLQLTSTAPEQALQFTVAFQTNPAGQSWLSARPPSGATPNVVFVDLFPQGLALGVYRGTVTITPVNAPAQEVPVELTITSGATLSIAPVRLDFEQFQGGPVPASQNLNLTASGTTPVTYTAGVTYTGTATNWLQLDPVSGTTPGTVKVTANGTALAQGTYTAVITVSAPGASNSPQNIQVSLTVKAPQTLAASQTSLTFNYQIGGPAPAVQQVQLTSSPGNLSFTAETSTESGGTWLTVTPASGTTPSNLGVGINTANLAAGQTYRGRIRITSAGASNSPVDIAVTLSVAATPVPVFNTIRNGASYVPGSVSPGEIVYIEGSNMGPATLTVATPSQGAFPTVLAETRVLFDGIPAPLIYVRNNAISAVVPYGIAGRPSTRLEIEYRGSKSRASDFTVADAKPGIFTLNSQGFGQGAIVNQTGVVNGPPGLIAGLTTAPAPQGSIVLIYVTGGGLTSPGVADGRANPSAEPLARLNQRVTVTIGNVPADVYYAGGSPGFIAGFIQLNVKVPDNAPVGNAVPVVVQVGGVSSQANVTMAVAARQQ